MTWTTPAWPGRSTPRTPRSTACCPRVVVRPRHVGRDRGHARGLPQPGRPADRSWRRHLDRRQRRRPGRRRWTPAGTCTASSTSTPSAPSRSWSRASSSPPSRRRASARPAVRPRPEHAQPLHHRRDDRQQRLRVTRAGLRAHLRQRHRARRGDRVGHPPAAGKRCGTRQLGVGARRSRSRCADSWSPTWRRSAPSSAASAARGPATPWSSCCPSAGSTSPARWSAARARWPSPSAPPCALVPDPSARVLVVLGYPTMADAADATPGILPHRPTACEGLDSRIVQRVRDVPAAVVPDLPRGDGWLVVELAGDDPAELAARAVRVVADAGALDSLVVTDPAEAAAIWRIREDGAGLAARTSDGPPGARGLGGRRGPGGAARPLPARLRGAARRSTACMACPTATSATAASTCGSTSRSAQALAGRRRPRGLPRLRGGRGAAGGRLRRVHVG